MPKANLEHYVSYHPAGHIICRRCKQTLMARVTVTADAPYVTCTNKVRRGAERTTCGQQLYLIAGPGFVHAVVVTAEVRSVIENGGSASDVLRALGLIEEPQRAA